MGGQVEGGAGGAREDAREGALWGLLTPLPRRSARFLFAPSLTPAPRPPPPPPPFFPAQAVRAAPKAKGVKAKAAKGEKPEGPKRAQSAYMAFVAENRKSIEAANPGASFGEKGKLMGAAWAALDDAGKKKYIDIAAKDKERYESEKAA